MPMQMPLPQAPRLSLVESTIGVMRTQIESGAWKVGERIPKEAELADMLQVSRNTVREAIRVLSYGQVLEVRQGDGTYVRSSIDPAETMRRVNCSNLRDHLELRAVLETEAARLAAQRRTDKDLKDLHDLLDARGSRADVAGLSAFVDRDVAFHVAITRASHNVALEELYRYFAAAVRTNTQIALGDREMPEPSRAAHARIVDAIERRDPERAAKAARAIVDSVITKLDDLLERASL